MKKALLFGLLTVSLLLGMVGYSYLRFADGKLHVIFCDVGQGDGILIKTPDRHIVIVDAGPDDSIRQCLARHLPFWHRTIDLAMLSHPHADHFFGFFTLLDHFTIRSFVQEDIVNSSPEYQELSSAFEREAISQKVVRPGDRWTIGAVSLRMVGPTDAYLKRITPDGTIDRCDGCPSLASVLSYGNFNLLLTGDTEFDAFDTIEAVLPENIAVMQIPHHGSRTGVNEDILEAIDPGLAVISVGAENFYNHPHPSVLGILSTQQIPVLRTDLVGDVEIVSDGEKWWVSK